MLKILEARKAPAAKKSKYRIALALFFNPYIRSHYKNAAQYSRSFSKLDSSFYLKIVACELKIIRVFRRWISILAILTTVYLYAITHPSPDTTMNYVIAIAGGVVVYGFEFVYPWWMLRELNEERATINLFGTVKWLERMNSNWNSSKIRWEFARRLELIAKYIERIPLASRGTALGVKREAIKTSKAKAQAIRQLELLAIHPETLALSDLVERLARDLHTIADNRWYELPEGDDFERVRSRWVLTFQVTASVLVIGLAIFLATLAAKMGPLYSLTAAILLGVGVALLSGAGIPMGPLRETLGHPNSKD